LILDNPTIDIPAGEANYKLKDSYTLPVDAELTTIFPHAHYLAREMQGYAILPDGTKRWLLDIKDWDFNWQGDYRFAQPIAAPKGTVLHMEFTYDNSTNNVRNPNHPPKRVQFGLQTTDEMGELWIQALPASPHDLSLLAEDFSQQGLLKMVKVGQHRVQKTPKDAKAHVDLAKTLVGMERLHEALKHLNTAVTLQPKNEEAHYFLGVVNRLNGNRKAARSEFEATLQLNASHYKAHGNLGMLDLEDGKVAPAELHFQEALRINPEDPLAREKLDRIALFRREGKIPLTR
jgi:tetratricopeptide (TPR) repeat protein